jgi:probable F420-dependent oxidoreductase
MARPFRFGIQLHSLPLPDWEDRLRLIEGLGYSTVFWPDHFGTQWDPVAGLAAAAVATERINVGALVYGVDYRHPVVMAKAAATIHLISGGRHEFGLGAGWMEKDYEQAGMPYDRPSVRIERLDEALQIIRSMWENDRTSFDGKHYQIRQMAQAAELPAGSRPKILVGGGGPKVLAVAGRHADIVGINPRIPEGRVTQDTAADLAPERVAEKVAWAREGAAAAGRSPDDIELSALAFVVAITDDPNGLRAMLSKNTGMTVSQIADSPLFLTGPASEIRDRLERRREELGISYVVIQGDDPETLERFAAAVVEPLAGKA